MNAENKPAAFDAAGLLKAFAEHDVRFLVVGGLSALSHGAQHLTQDLDCVPDRSPQNLDAIADALRQLNARLRIDRVSDHESRQLPVDINHVVRAQEVSLWQTDAGPVDVLHSLRDRDGERHDYHDLHQRSLTRHIGQFAVDIVSLDDLIASKEWANRPKDREALDELHSLRRASLAPQAPTAPEGTQRRGDASLPPGPRKLHPQQDHCENG